jgi:micrococcal nuclease
VAVVAVLVVGCNSGSTSSARPRPRYRGFSTPTSEAPASSATTPSVPPTASPSTTPPSQLLARPPGLDGPYGVARVVDGDTIKLATGITIRMIGVDTPETVDPRKPVQCFGREASLRAHALLDGAAVSLEYDATQGRLDKYGRTLAYVWMPDGRLYNQVIIADGYAHEYTYAIPYRYRDAFLAAERDAREEDRGLWSPSACAGDTTTPALTNPPTGPRAGCDASYPDVCIPPPPPDLDCAQISFRRFRVVGADPQRFDADHDGIGCE